MCMQCVRARDMRSPCLADARDMVVSQMSRLRRIVICKRHWEPVLTCTVCVTGGRVPGRAVHRRVLAKVWHAALSLRMFGAPSVRFSFTTVMRWLSETHTVGSNGQAQGRRGEQPPLSDAVMTVHTAEANRQVMASARLRQRQWRALRVSTQV